MLDVGCGGKPRGDVNVDLYPDGYHYIKVDKQKTRNFVKADGQKLPFKNGCFRVVVSSHLLEHMEHPLTVLQEWSRVASAKVVVTVPCLTEGRNVAGDSRAHLYTWSAVSLRNLMKKVFREVEVKQNSKCLSLLRKGVLPSTFNFVLSNLLGRLSVFQNPELTAVGKKEV